MGRYKFRWANLGPDVLAGLADQIGADGDAVEALTSTYGARPKEEFVRDTWPQLIDIWLRRDEDRLRRLAERVASRGVGDQTINRSTETGQAEFLRSCRNTTVLRADVLAMLIERGEQNEPGEAPQSREHSSGDLRSLPSTVFPSGGEPFTEWVAAQLETVYGEGLKPDDDGDIPIRSGSSVTYLRPIDDELPRLEFFSIVVTGVTPTAEMLDMISQLDQGIVVGKLVLLGDTVQLQHVLLATGLSAEQMAATLDLLGASADALDDLLAERLGGATFLPANQPEVADDEQPGDAEVLQEESASRTPVSGRVPSGDVGLRAINELREALQIDDAWMTPFDRGFSWWSYRLAQHVSVDAVQSDGRMDFATVRITTDVVREVTRPDAAVEWVSLANTQQTLNALIWDANARVIRECCTAVVTEENLGWLGKVILAAAAMQNTAAHSRAPSLAETVGGVPAESAHPATGRRDDPDEILLVPEQVIASAGQQPSAFHGDLIEALEPFVQQQMGLMGFADESGFSCEIPYTSSISALEASALGGAVTPGTALVRIDADIAHPQYGSGALLTMHLPGAMPRRQTAEWASWLNQLEAATTTDTSLLGAWCPDPAGDDAATALAFVAFIPSLLARGGLLQNLVIYQTGRARLAASYLGPQGASS